MYCNIIVTRPFDHVFTYDVGSAKVKKGQIVLVPFGKSTEVGMIFETNVSKPNYKIKKPQRQKQKKYAPMDSQTRKLLIEFFKPHNERLFKFIGKKFDWEN